MIAEGGDAMLNGLIGSKKLGDDELMTKVA